MELTMPRLQFTVTEEMEKELRDKSRKTGIPMSVLLRRAAEQLLEKDGTKVKADVQWGGNRREPQSA
jgi:hypothetical protein